MYKFIYIYRHPVVFLHTILWIFAKPFARSINQQQCFISILTFGCSFHRKQTNMWHLCLQLELTLSVFHLYIQNRESIFKLIKVKMKLINQAFNQLVIFKVTASTGRLCNAFNNFHEFSITAQCYFFFVYLERVFIELKSGTR